MRTSGVTRVQVRPGEHRGKSGYLISGSYERGFPTRIFVRQKASAEQIRELLKRGDLPLSARATAVDEIIRSDAVESAKSDMDRERAEEARRLLRGARAMKARGRV